MFLYNSTSGHPIHNNQNSPRRHRTVTMSYIAHDVARCIQAPAQDPPVPKTVTHSGTNRRNRTRRWRWVTSLIRRTTLTATPGRLRRHSDRPVTGGNLVDGLVSTWLRATDTDVVSVNIGIHSAWRKAGDRTLWWRIVDKAALHHGARQWKEKSVLNLYWATAT